MRRAVEVYGKACLIPFNEYGHGKNFKLAYRFRARKVKVAFEFCKAFARVGFGFGYDIIVQPYSLLGVGYVRARRVVIRAGGMYFTVVNVGYGVGRVRAAALCHPVNRARAYGNYFVGTGCRAFYAEVVVFGDCAVKVGGGNVLAHRFRRARDYEYDFIFVAVVFVGISEGRGYGFVFARSPLFVVVDAPAERVRLYCQLVYSVALFRAVRYVVVAVYGSLCGVQACVSAERNFKPEHVAVLFAVGVKGVAFAIAYRCNGALNSAVEVVSRLLLPRNFYVLRLNGVTALHSAAVCVVVVAVCGQERENIIARVNRLFGGRCKKLVTDIVAVVVEKLAYGVRTEKLTAVSIREGSLRYGAAVPLEIVAETLVRSLGKPRNLLAHFRSRIVFGREVCPYHVHFHARRRRGAHVEFNEHRSAVVFRVVAYEFVVSPVRRGKSCRRLVAVYGIHRPRGFVRKACVVAHAFERKTAVHALRGYRLEPGTFRTDD